MIKRDSSTIVRICNSKPSTSSSSHPFTYSFFCMTSIFNNMENPLLHLGQWKTHFHSTFFSCSWCCFNCASINVLPLLLWSIFKQKSSLNLKYPHCAKPRIVLRFQENLHIWWPTDVLMELHRISTAQVHDIWLYSFEPIINVYWLCIDTGTWHIKHHKPYKTLLCCRIIQV